MSIVSLYHIKQNNVVNLFKRLKSSGEKDKTSLSEQQDVRTNKKLSSFFSDIATSEFKTFLEIQNKYKKKEHIKQELCSVIMSSEEYKKAVSRIGKKNADSFIQNFSEESCKFVKSDTNVSLFLSTIENMLDNGVLSFMSVGHLKNFSSFFKNADTMELLKYLIQVVDRKDVLMKIVTLDNINPKKVEILKSRVGDISLLNTFSVKNIVGSSEEDWGQMIKMGLNKIGYVGLSENEDINKLFLKTHNISNFRLKEIEDAIRGQFNDNPEKIKDIVSKLSKNNDCIADLAFSNFKMIDMDTFSDYASVVKTKYSTSQGYDVHCKDIFNLFRSHNKSVIKELFDIKDVDIRTLRDTLRYCDTSEKSKEICSVISDIKNNNRSILELPFVKYSRVNDKILNLKNKEYIAYEDGTDLSKIKNEIIQGEVVFVGNKTYIKDKGELVKLQIDASKYKELFPPFDSQVMRQGNLSRDCMFLSHELLAFWRNPLARPALLKSIKQDGQDIVISLPRYKKLQVRFVDGKPKGSFPDLQISNTAQGNILLEQSMIIVAYANANKIEDLNSIDFEYALKNIPQSVSLCNIFLPENYSNFYHDESMFDALAKYAKRDDVLLGARTQWKFDRIYKDCDAYGIIEDHAYFIEKVDEDKKTVRLVNPFNSLHSVDVPFDVFKNYFRNVHVTELS